MIVLEDQATVHCVGYCCRYKMFLYIFQGIFTTRESSELRCLGQKAPEAVPGPQAELPQL